MRLGQPPLRQTAGDSHDPLPPPLLPVAARRTPTCANKTRFPPPLLRAACLVQRLKPMGSRLQPAGEPLRPGTHWQLTEVSWQRRQAVLSVAFATAVLRAAACLCVTAGRLVPRTDCWRCAPSLPLQQTAAVAAERQQQQQQQQQQQEQQLQPPEQPAKQVPAAEQHLVDPGASATAGSAAEQSLTLEEEEPAQQQQRQQSAPADEEEEEQQQSTLAEEEGEEQQQREQQQQQQTQQQQQAAASQAPADPAPLPWAPVLSAAQLKRGLSFYGTGQRTERVVAKLMAGQPITAVGSGSKGPSFLHSVGQRQGVGDRLLSSSWDA